ncbi:MAG: peptidase MA family metallohydrolase [Candidatus Omnitrophota bacterium]|nr:peptidase MA family metallohydrolase [Candidatus Omnitrophota bacterium]
MMPFRVSFFLMFSLMITTSAGFAEDEKSSAAKALERRQKVQLMSFFHQDPKQAKLPTAPMAIELFNQAVEFYQQQEYELALEVLRDSLHYDDQNALAYELIGDIYYLQQKLADAKENYQIAFALRPQADLKAKIEKLRAEATVERGLATYREKHFIIKYRGEDMRFEGYELRELLRQTYRDLSKTLGYYFNHKVVVVLYDQKEFAEITRLPHWAAGVYDGKVRMPIYKQGFQEIDLKALTVHEVTHAFVAGMSSRRAPAWVNEGLAEYFERQVQPGDDLVLKAAIKTNTLIAVDKLMLPGITGSLNDPLLITLFYDQSYSLVRYMIDRYGLFRMKKLLEEFGKGSNSDEALRKVLRISPLKLEAEWKETL